MASGIKGLTKLRRTLRRIPDETEGGVRQAIATVSEAIKQDAISLAPRNEGDLVRAIDMTFSSDRLASVIGPGVKGIRAEKRQGRARARGVDVNISAASRDALFQFSKGLWHEFGTKGSPERNIPPLPARPFMGPAYNLNEEYGKQLMRAAVKKALQKASAG